MLSSSRPRATSYRPFLGVVTNRFISHFEILAKEDFTIFIRKYRIPYRSPYQGSSYPRAHARFARPNFKSRVRKSPVRASRALKSQIARCKRRDARNKSFDMLQNVNWMFYINQWILFYSFKFFVRAFGAHIIVCIINQWTRVSLDWSSGGGRIFEKSDITPPSILHNTTYIFDFVFELWEFLFFMVEKSPAPFFIRTLVYSNRFRRSQVVQRGYCYVRSVLFRSVISMWQASESDVIRMAEWVNH